VVPANITILYLPPYSPELNPVERLWGYLRSHYLSNRAYDGYGHLLNASVKAWQDLTPETLRSVCACGYITHELKL
jgi:transposase